MCFFLFVIINGGQVDNNVDEKERDCNKPFAAERKFVSPCVLMVKKKNK